MSSRVLVLLLPLHLLAAWLFLLPSGPGLPLDDAWGHLVYGRSLVQGELFAYNPGQPEAGVTAPLWTALAALPAAAQAWLGFERVDLGLRLLGALFGWLVAGVGTRIALRVGKSTAVATALLLTFDPLLLAARFSGMELPLFMLWTLLFIESELDGRATRSGWWAGLALLTRPEGLILVAWAAVRSLRARRHPGPVLLPALVCALPFAAFNLWAAGQPWPNTWSNKAQVVIEGASLLASLGALGGDTGWGWGLPVLLLVGTFSCIGEARRAAILCLTASLLLLAGVLASREMPTAFDPPRVPFYWERYALIAWPPLLIVAGAALASFARTLWAAARCRPAAAAILVAPIVATGVLARGVPGHALDVSRRFAAEVADVQAQQVAAGLWIDAHLPPDALVASHDAGAVRWFGKRAVLDIYGNNAARLNRLIARRDRAQARGDEAGAARAHAAVLGYLDRQRPDALVCFPILWAAGHSPELQALLPTLAEGDAASLLARADDWAALFGLTRRAASFPAPHGAVVGGPLHDTLAIFVRP